MRVRPLSYLKARAFIEARRGTIEPPRPRRLEIALENKGEIVAAAMLGKPRAHCSDDGDTLEIVAAFTLPYVDGVGIYAASEKLAAALGYARTITSTRNGDIETAEALRAAGYKKAGRDRTGTRWTKERKLK